MSKTNSRWDLNLFSPCRLLIPAACWCGSIQFASAACWNCHVHSRVTKSIFAYSLWSFSNNLNVAVSSCNNWTVHAFLMLRCLLFVDLFPVRIVIIPLTCCFTSTCLRYLATKAIVGRMVFYSYTNAFVSTWCTHWSFDFKIVTHMRKNNLCSYYLKVFLINFWKNKRKHWEHICVGVK